MSFVNFVAVDGRLVKDAEVNFGSSGTAVLNFTIAHNTKVKEKEEVSFFDVVCFGKQAEAIADHLTKGTNVVVCGRLNQSRWEKDGKKYSRTKVIASQVSFGKTKEAPKGDLPTDSDIPF